MTGPLQVTGEVLNVRPAGAYSVLTLALPGVPERVRPGHFVALSVGGPAGATVLRRSFAVYAARTAGISGPTVDLVFSVRGAGTEWLADRRRGDPVDVVGPLGRPFRLPQGEASATLVGGGYGSAPLLMLAERLRARGCRVDMVLGAATADRVFGQGEAGRVSQLLAVTTEDGSAGTRGRVTDVLPSVLARAHTDVVYACGPMGMLAAVSAMATAQEIPSQVAVEESMACGIGVCMTCVLPVVGSDGRTRMVRSCVEGPVLPGDRVRWADVGTIPVGTIGAPAAVPSVPAGTAL